MNLETQKSNKNSIAMNELEMDEFDFKPITSGLGFHQQKTSEVKPAFVESPIAKMPEIRPMRKEAPVYQNDLSLFYGSQNTQVQMPHLGTQAMAPTPVVEAPVKIMKKASTVERISAYILDLLMIVSILGIILTAMAHSLEMDLMQAWSEFPHEMTPLVVTLFCGFYLMYFSIFEKGQNSTIGKSLFNLKVVSVEDQALTYSGLLLRSTITLLNFISLGLFSYFDLQGKITHSKVVQGR